uniref:Uncharacterized protein n=1 Tax=Arundo donax TaxID=35708 RepID=A0A0A9EHV3_ARUDO
MKYINRYNAVIYLLLLIF